MLDSFKEENAEIIPFSIRSKIDLFAINKLVNIIKIKKVNVVHSHQTRLDFFGFISAKIANVPFIFTRHATSDLFIVNRLLKNIYMFMDRTITVKYANQIVAVSKAVADDLIVNEKANPSKIKIIYAGLDLDKHGKEVETGRIREEFNMTRDIPLVGIVGRINVQKAHQYFLKAAAEVLKIIPEVKFLIVGDGPIRKQQEELAENLGISSQIIFTGYRTDIAQVMADIDVSVLTSITEALGIVNLEAMAMSKPVVCFDVGGISELVVNGKTGILVSPMDYKALAKAIIELIRDKEKAKRMGIEGQKRVRENFTLNTMVKQYEKLYKSIVKN